MYVVAHFRNELDFKFGVFSVWVRICFLFDITGKSAEQQKTEAEYYCELLIR